MQARGLKNSLRSSKAVAEVSRFMQVPEGLM